MLIFPRWKKLLVLSICAFFTYLALPSFLHLVGQRDLPDWLPKKTLNLGLDLRGGSHLLLQLDVDHYLREQLQNLSDDLRLQLREKRLRYQKIALQPDGVVFESTSASEEITQAVYEMDPVLELTQQAEGAYRLAYGARALRDMQKKLLEQSIEIINRRVNETGTREPIIQAQGADRILVQVPGLKNPEHLKALLGKTAKMTFHLVDLSVTPEEIYAGTAPPGTRLMESDDPAEKGADGRPLRYAIKGRVMLSGESLTGATATFEQGQPVVAFKLDRLGARKFAQITQENTGKPFAIILDNKVITAPRINEPILSGSGIISGNFTVESANDLALLLRAGALPAPLKIIEERTVGPSLGADSIEAGQRASVLSIVLVVIFMALFYGRFGLYADIALLMNGVLIVGALSLLQATLTLPGIAGIVLTFGMAVDANVLIYERIREELAVGKSPAAALEHGFKSAFGTIMDSNVTTLIAAFLLFYFGSGTIKGFAVTLSIGIVSSMFTAILLTRMLVYRWFNKRRPKTLPL